MRRTLSRTKRTAIGAGAVLGSLGLGGAGFALVSGGNAGAASSTASSPAPGSTTAKGHTHMLLRRAVNATVTIKTKDGYETLELARGTVTSISSSSITVQSPNGTSMTATINSSTRFHNTTEQQLANGDKVGVLSYEGVARWVNAPKSSTSGSGSTSTPSS